MKRYEYDDDDDDDDDDRAILQQYSIRDLGVVVDDDLNLINT